MHRYINTSRYNISRLWCIDISSGVGKPEHCHTDKENLEDLLKLLYLDTCGLVVRVHGYRSKGPGFDSRCYQIFRELVGLERGPLCLVSTTEELLGRKSSGSGIENRDYGRRDPLSWPRGTLYPQTLALTSPTSGGRSVGILRSRIQAKEFF
jgi:hypothetical protein